MTTIQEASEKIAKARQEMDRFAKSEGKSAIGAAFRPFFGKFTEAEAIKWTQYTPHFNDGDVCTFGVNECQVFDAYGEEIHAFKHPENQELMGAFSDIWESIDEDLLEACFGDGVQITITAEDVTVEDYDHD